MDSDVGSGINGFEVDPDALAGTTKGFSDVELAVGDALARLVATLEECGACWGPEDEAGKLFEPKYVPVAMKTLDQLGSIVKGLRGMVDNIPPWARHYVESEGAITDMM